MQNSGIPVSHAAVCADDRRETIGEMTFSQILMKLISDVCSKLRKPICDLIKLAREFDFFKQFGIKQPDNGGGSADKRDTTIQVGVDTPGINSVSKVPHHVLEKAAKSDLLERLIIRPDEDGDDDGGPDPKMRRKMKVSDRKRVDPNLVVMSFCLAAAIGLLLIPNDTRSSSSLQYDLLSLAVALNFSIVIVTIEISNKFPAARQALHVVGTLLASLSALAMALCFPLSIGLSCVLLFLIFILSIPGSISARQRWIIPGEESPSNSTSS